LIVVGPSGVGKNTMLIEVIKEYGELFERKISFTTRPKKNVEKASDNYYFISKEEFMRVRIE
jgi:guanylate kinase